MGSAAIDLAAYPQAEDAQLVKLDAFIARYVRRPPPGAARALAAFSQRMERRAKRRRNGAALWPPASMRAGADEYAHARGPTALAVQAGSRGS